MIDVYYGLSDRSSLTEHRSIGASGEGVELACGGPWGRAPQKFFDDFRGNLRFAPQKNFHYFRGVYVMFLSKTLTIFEMLCF